MHKLIAATATATSAMSIGTLDRAENEQDYQHNALKLLTKALTDKDKEDYDLVAVEKP